jgi:HEAT repeat protein
MAESIEQKVREVLKPTDARASWREAVLALDANEAVPILVTILLGEGEKLLTRKMVATVLGLLRNERSMAALTQTLRASDPILRAKAAGALGEFEKVDKNTVKDLIEALRDKDYYVRESAARALGQLKRPEALAALEQMSSTDSISTNQDVARKAIETISRTG